MREFTNASENVVNLGPGTLTTREACIMFQNNGNSLVLRWSGWFKASVSPVVETIASTF